MIAGHIGGDHHVHVRVGAANAGHTVYTNAGVGWDDPNSWDKHVMQQLPCAAYANPQAKVVLGAGAMISWEILEAEIERNIQWRADHGLMPLQLFIDERAHVVLPEHVAAEQDTDLADRIGSTSTIAREGIGAAQAARVMRTGYMTAGEFLAELASGVFHRVQLCDTVELLHNALAFDASVMLEGTQGTGLSNTVGQYPYVTSRHTTAPGLLADTGLSEADQVIMVCRSFPIRVAGNSGPFWSDSVELNWDAIGIDSEKERTTVTKKVRRVASLSVEQIAYAALVNGATEIALTFADYLDPGIYGRCGSMDAVELDGYDRVGGVCRQIESRTGVPVTFVGTGPHSVIERVSDLFDDE